MDRLTELIDIDGMVIKVSKERPLSNQGLGAILHKLYALEDIEKDLGCPLEVVFKALNGFYTEFGYISNEDDFIYLRKDSEGWYLKVVIHPSKPKPKNLDWFEIQRLKDHKKTWWLSETKEE